MSDQHHQDIYSKHDFISFIIHTVFFLASVITLIYGFVGELLTMESWFYFLVLAIFWGFNFIVLVLTRGGLRHFFTLIVVAGYAFLLPLNAFTHSRAYQVAVIFTAIYLLSVIAFTSNDLSLMAFLCSGLAILTFHRIQVGNKIDFSAYDYLIFAFTFVCLTGLGLMWRFFFARLYALIKGLPQPEHVHESIYRKVVEENRKLREAIVKHIIRLSQKTGFQPFPQSVPPAQETPPESQGTEKNPTLEGNKK